MYDLDQTIRERRSVRGFLPNPVPREVLEEVLGLAQHAPSNCNVQPWRVYIASGNTLEKLRAALLQEVTTASSPVMVAPIDEFLGVYRKKQRVGRLNASLRNFQFFDAPHVAYICMAKSFGIGVALDVGMYVQTLMLAMQSRGISSCAQAALRAYPELVGEHLRIPDDEQILCGLSFGYEDPTVPANQTRQPRDPISSNVVFRGDVG
jgi:nitroreductase